jgi:hypothetical protein
VIKDKITIYEIPDNEPIIKRMAIFFTTIEKGIKNMFPKISNFTVLKTLGLILNTSLY